MARLGLEREIADSGVYKRTVERFREKGIRLPTFQELADPSLINERISAALATIDPDAASPLNLYRVHWYNGNDRRATAAVPQHVVFPPEVTGVAAPIVVLLGDRFPMIRAHKVLAAYGCLAPRVITGQFDPTHHRAIWPSTGNYCRGGVAVSKIMDCRGVAVLPEQMSRERFEWLDRWVLDPLDVVRTPGCESNVKEIYDKCHELDLDPQNIIFNQFCEFGNYLVHYACTGRAVERVFEHLAERYPGATPAAFISATGSAGTIGAGDYLKHRHGARIVAVEAQECPTLLYNGFGDHNIQGIGDKHVPYIHNVMNTDAVAGVSERVTDSLSLLFNTPAGREYLSERAQWPAELVDSLSHFGYSSICNLAAAIKTAQHFNLGADDLLFTVATDGAEMYDSERPELKDRWFDGRWDLVEAGRCYGRDWQALTTDHYLELTQPDKERIFNLGYFTWVEQQGVSVAEFSQRRKQTFWDGLHEYLPIWDELIDRFNAETGVELA